MANYEGRRVRDFLSQSGLISRLCALILCCWISSVSCQTSAVPCVDSRGMVQRCHPEFENAAFQLDVEASNTCGEYEAQKFCRQTGVTGVIQQCSFCDSTSPSEMHPARFLTDIHEEENMTWWQSETMFEGVQYPQAVNLTLSLGKSFEITYIRLKFYSPRPESFAIYKRTTQDGPWIPYQYYSGSCQSTYGVRPDEVVTRNFETKALCTAAFSDISPLTGGNIAFSTLEQRPSAYYFDESSVLQEWVTATDILVMLTRQNTFGDEVFRVEDVLRSYYYAISDFSIGGRCKCNGHASACIPGSGSQRLVCQCEHNTDGPDCEKCLPFYNDRPWARGTSDSINECVACDCNGNSATCFFDQELYDATGHGGHCTDCQRNTAGVNCERCETNYYEDRDGNCVHCRCDRIGSLHQQCDRRGVCQCRDGVGGAKCDRCLPNYHDFGVTGCRSCDCNVPGSLNNEPECDSNTGRCRCKENVEGKQCERCKSGYFNLDESDRFGCLACFCYGHSSDCTSAPGFELVSLDDDFTRGTSDWSVEYADGSVDFPVYNAIRRDIAVASDDSSGEVYFVAPDEYLGDKRSSYGRDFSFQLRLGSGDIVLSPRGIILEGDGMTIYAPIVAQGNSQPGVVAKEYVFSLRHERDLGWVQNPTAFEFQRVLTNLTGLKIRATYSTRGQGFLDNVRLEMVRRSTGPGGTPVSSIELCSCPDGYVGQFCESCAAGYRREPPNGGPYALCIPCECNGHSDICDVDSGICICQHNTYGDSCELCLPGYYGNALDGTPYDCEPCPCPGGSECIQDAFGEVVCINCPRGYVGNRCEMCADGYFGDPYGEFGAPSACIRCDCNGNVDSNAIGNCNSTTGECLKCIYNTDGFYCQDCLAGYYGDALATPKGQCQPCNCYGPGSESYECNQVTGQCDCLPFVRGQDCSYCRNRYWNINSGRGCEPCNCSPIGSVQQDCDEDTGQCECKPGVGGQLCDACLFDHHGFTEEGCTPCNCNPQGSVSASCTYDGVCDCQEGVIGDKCDSCEENFYNIALGCVECPVCYNLVQDKVNEHRQKLEELKKLLEGIGEDTGPVVNDINFEKQLKIIGDELDKLMNDSMRAIDEDNVLKSDMESMRMMYDMLMDQVREIRAAVKSAEDNTEASQRNQEETFDIIEDAKMKLVQAQEFLDQELAKLRNQFNETARNQSEQDRLMQQLAEEARSLVAEQGSQADVIEPTSSEALNTSLSALAAVQNVTGLGELEEQVTKLEDDYGVAQVDFEAALQRAMEVKAKGVQALNDANALLSKARQPLTPIDAAALNESATDIKLAAEAILREAAMISDQNEMLLNQIEADSQKAADLLDDSREVQQELDLLLAEADRAEADAEAAKEKGNRTLEEAQQILKTLESFEEQVEKSREEANNATQKIPEIEANIDMANSTALGAQETIDAAKGDAMQARDVANTARDNATDASETAKEKLKEAEEEKKAAQKEKDRADSLAADVNSTMMRLSAIDDQARNDSDAVREAQVKANAADKASSQAMLAVEAAIEKVEELIDALDDLGDIDQDALDNAYDDFLNLNNTYWNDLNVDGIMERMRDFQLQQEMEIKNHQLSLVEIRKQVQNVQDISDSLPDFCPNKQKLENTGK